MKDTPPGDFLKPLKENKNVNVPEHINGSLGDASKADLKEGFVREEMKKRPMKKYIWGL